MSSPSSARSDTIVPEKRQRGDSHPSGPDSIPRGLAKLLFKTLSGEEKKALSRGLSALGSELRIFTGCSGSEVQQHCGSVMLELMSGGNVHYRTIASCENDKRKQRWILEVVNADCELKVKPHLFEDLKGHPPGSCSLRCPRPAM